MKTEKLSHCTVCGSENLEDFLSCKDYFVSGEVFSISRCKTCGFCFTDPRPAAEDIGPYYDSSEYVSHSKTSHGLTNRLFHLARNFTLARKKRILKKYSPGKRILDYGCGTGEFLARMKSASWTCTGIEANAPAREHAIQKYALTVTDESELENLEDSSFDAISLWHVLEHVYPLRERLESFHKILDPDGTIFVALPNMNSFDAKIYGEHWAAYDLPRHIYHFTPATIQQLMGTSGFNLVKTLPMPLDAYYISMLSEKYRHGSGRIIRAGWNGFRSNFHARFKTGNYSSLIYIFKKSK